MVGKTEVLFLQNTFLIFFHLLNENMKKISTLLMSQFLKFYYFIIKETRISEGINIFTEGFLY